MKQVMVILVGDREHAAVNLQKLLTEWGCLIKTRLGIHDGVLDECSTEGLVILEVVGDQDKIDELCRKINLLHKVKAELVKLEVD